MTPGRHRSWVLASLSRFCAVCGGRRRVAVWPVGAPELVALVRCPHCAPPHLPIAITKETTS